MQITAYNVNIFSAQQNDTECFRQFIAGFVDIWQQQLDLNFDTAPAWSEIKADVGPHLKRLPEELLPAIGKFLIIARDACQNDDGLKDEALAETTLLLKCLTVVCRHFDNIQTVANYQYIGCALNISMNIIISVSERQRFWSSTPNRTVLMGTFTSLQLFKDKRKPTAIETEYIRAFSQLIEVIYDPYLTWRNFLQGSFADHRRIWTSVVPLNVELVPFIYGELQMKLNIIDI